MKRTREDAFTSDEENDQTEGVDYVSDDEAFEHAMVRALDRTEQLGVPSTPIQ